MTGRIGAVVALACLFGLATDAAAATPRAQDHRLVRAGILRRADVGDTWHAGGASSAAIRFGPRKLTECRQVTRATHRQRSDWGTSGAFENGDATVSNSVIVYRSALAASRAFKALNSDTATTCLHRALLDDLTPSPPTSGASAATVSIVSTPPPRLGDERTAFLVDAKASSKGDDAIGVNATLVVLRIGRVVTAATFAGASAPPAQAVEQVLLPAARTCGIAAEVGLGAPLEARSCSACEGRGTGHALDVSR